MCMCQYMGFAYLYIFIPVAVSDTSIKQHSVHMVDHRNCMHECIVLSIKTHCSCVKEI